MRRIFSIITYISAAIATVSCAKNETVGPNDENQRYFEAWMHVNHPGVQPTGLGFYIIDEKQGTGEKVGDDGFVLVNYKTTDLEGNITTYTDAKTAQQLGTYQSTSYYGPKFWTTTETTLPAGVRDAIVGMPVGTHRKIVVPSWLMSYQAYDSEADYLNPPIKKNEEYDASSYSSTIYELTIEDYTSDISKWQIDSIGRFFSNSKVYVDGRPAADIFKKAGAQMTAADSTSLGFYYKQIKAPENTKKFGNDTTIYINYVGKLLNGLVFDTNIERVAKDNGLYSTSASYKPFRINWGEEYTDITMGNDESSIIAGFAKTLWQMKAMEKGVGVFYSNLGYGYSGSGSSIPAYSPLIFEIELVAKPEE